MLPNRSWLAQIGAVGVHDEQVGQPAVIAREHELPPVGGPGGRGQPVQRDRDTAELAPFLDIEDDEVVFVLVLCGDREVARIR